jgi:hypothetical protein
MEKLTEDSHNKLMEDRRRSERKEMMKFGLRHKWKIDHRAWDARSDELS